MNDSIADLLTRIRNAQIRGLKVVSVNKTRVNLDICNVLKSEGFVDSFSEVKEDDASFPHISIWLKYFPDKRPFISNIKRVSKGGRRVYKKCDEIKKVRSGLGISIVSTSRGIMSDRDAKKNNLGGELMATVS